MANNTITAKIAVVEDNTEDMMWMTAAVQEVFPFAQVFSFPDLKSFQAKGEKFDLLVLDVFLGNENSIRLAAQLWKSASYILYVTINPTMMAAAFGPKVIGFYAKKDGYASLTVLLEKLGRKYLTAFERVPTTSGNIMLDMHSVMYMQSDNRIIKVYCENERHMITDMSLSECASLYSRYLIPVSRTVLINPDQLLRITDHLAVMADDKVIPVSRRKMRMLKQEIMRRGNDELFF